MDKLLEKVTQLLDKLSTKLGVATDVLWEALMKQALIAGIADLLWIVIYVIGSVGMYHWGRIVDQHVQSKDRDERWDDVAWVPFGVAAAVWIILGIATLAHLPMMFAAFFNQEYWAVMKIIRH